jgi:hypothetical protein
MPDDFKDVLDQLDDPELVRQIGDWRIVSLREASIISSLSVESLRRHHKSKILQLSPSRRGMRLRDVLALGKKAK